MLRELLQVYAIRAREFSDTVARLGKHDRIGPEFLQLIAEIKKRRQLCISSGEDLDRWIQREDLTVRSSVPDNGNDDMVSEMNAKPCSIESSDDGVLQSRTEGGYGGAPTGHQMRSLRG